MADSSSLTLPHSMGSTEVRCRSLRKRTNDCVAMDDSDHEIESDSSIENKDKNLEVAGSVEPNVPSSENDTEESDDDGSFSCDDNSSSGGGEWMDAGDVDSIDGSSSSEDEVSCHAIHDFPLEHDNNDPKLHANAGWADAMAKILRTSKPKGKKTVVLAKAKKLSQIPVSEKPKNVEENYGFEIDGEIKTEDADMKPEVKFCPNKSDDILVKAKSRRREHLAEVKVKPSVLHRERERALSKIATKGVVQLFNAVREQQKDISMKLKEANGSVRKEEKVLRSIDKRAFLDVLMGNARSEKVEDHVRTKPEEDVKAERQENPATWSVLRDNFLTGSNLKDWDKYGEIKLEDDIEEVELH